MHHLEAKKVHTLPTAVSATVVDAMFLLHTQVDIPPTYGGIGEWLLHHLCGRWFRHRQLSVSMHKGHGACCRIQHTRSSTEASNWMPKSFTLTIIQVSIAQVPLLWVAVTIICPDFIRAFPILCIGWPVPQVHRVEWICGTRTSTTITVQTWRSWQYFWHSCGIRYSYLSLGRDKRMCIVYRIWYTTWFDTWGMNKMADIMQVTLSKAYC